MVEYSWWEIMDVWENQVQKWQVFFLAMQCCEAWHLLSEFLYVCLSVYPSHLWFTCKWFKVKMCFATHNSVSLLSWGISKHEFRGSPWMSALKRGISCRPRNLMNVWKWYNIECKFLLFSLSTNRKSHTGFHLVPIVVTLNDLKQRNCLYFALLPNSVAFGANYVKVVLKIQSVTEM